MPDRPRLAQARAKRIEEILESWFCCPQSREVLLDEAGKMEVVIDLNSIEISSGAMCKFCMTPFPGRQKLVKIVSGSPYSYAFLDYLDISEDPVLESLPQ